MNSQWNDSQRWEAEWWAGCVNTYNEETKQYIYARYMSLDEFATNDHGRRGWDFGNRSVVDIGGGPCSILLKSKARKRTVVDPCMYPIWVLDRYEDSGIFYANTRAEEFMDCYDLALMYNCLQHVEDPEKVCLNIKRSVKELRIYEWLNIPACDGHLHVLTTEKLDSWIGGHGRVKNLNEGPCVGTAYFGIFPFGDE
jgi:2-polyprenyl-3-methyl-5-hydroxy-6-metoxy-1,4-benzoquinol methylase